MQPGNSPRPCPRFSPLCFLGFSCHDVIVRPLPSWRYVPAGTSCARECPPAAVAPPPGGQVVFLFINPLQGAGHCAAGPAW
jgi:hypothetical protein